MLKIKIFLSIKDECVTFFMTKSKVMEKEEWDEVLTKDNNKSLNELLEKAKHIKPKYNMMTNFTYEERVYLHWP